MVMFGTVNKQKTANIIMEKLLKKFKKSLKALRTEAKWKKLFLAGAFINNRARLLQSLVFFI